MPHSPPVPPGNQSPYPLHEQPHHAAESNPSREAAPRAPRPDEDGSGLLPILAAAGAFGLVAGALTLFLNSRSDGDDAKARSAKRRDA